MRLRVERQDLMDAVAWTARTLPTRSTVPVLSGLLLESGTGEDTDGLRLSGFDFEVAAEARVGVTVAEGGRVLVSGKLLAEICRSLPAAPVDLATEGNRLVLVCGSARFQLPTMPVEDYPSLPAMPPVTGRIASAAFATAVQQVAVAAGRDDTLPVLTGVRVEIDGDTLTLAATDRYRLAVRELPWRPETPAGSSVALVPARTLADTAKALAGSSAEVEIALGTGAQGEGMAGFANGDLRTTTRLLEGEFPKYRALLPDSSDAFAELDTQTLTDAVKRVALVTAGRTTPVRLTFDDSGEALLEAGSGEDAQASERLPATFEGEPLTIAFNPAFLLDGLGQLDGDTARLSFTAPTKPAVLTGKVTDQPAEYRYLLMPVRLPS
ncbi:MAG TPA: DNA polymerase III subunit beta [Mycobacteriales bacterium]|nr:DNA polymerase III subunit beta [Mycobacteriales bacterium]